MLAEESNIAVAICVGLDVAFVLFFLVRARGLPSFLLFLINSGYYIMFIVVHYLILVQRAHIGLSNDLCDSFRSEESAKDYLDDVAYDVVDGKDDGYYIAYKAKSSSVLALRCAYIPSKSYLYYICLN